MKISLSTASKYTGTKKDMHRLMEADGWYLPSENSSIVTKEFLRDVRAHRVLCPKITDIKLQACKHPPKVEMLVEYLINGLTTNFDSLFETEEKKTSARDS